MREPQELAGDRPKERRAPTQELDRYCITFLTSTSTVTCWRSSLVFPCRVRLRAVGSWQSSPVSCRRYLVLFLLWGFVLSSRCHASFVGDVPCVFLSFLRGFGPVRRAILEGHITWQFCTAVLSPLPVGTSLRAVSGRMVQGHSCVASNTVLAVHVHLHCSAR